MDALTKKHIEFVVEAFENQYQYKHLLTDSETECYNGEFVYYDKHLPLMPMHTIKWSRARDSIEIEQFAFWLARNFKLIGSTCLVVFSSTPVGLNWIPGFEIDSKNAAHMYKELWKK